MVSCRPAPGARLAVDWIHWRGCLAAWTPPLACAPAFPASPPPQVLIEPRDHRHMKYVLENFDKNMPLNYDLYVFHGKTRRVAMSAWARAPAWAGGRRRYAQVDSWGAHGVPRPAARQRASPCLHVAARAVALAACASE